LIDLTSYLDFTHLNDSAADLDQFLDDAAKHKVASVCVYPQWIAKAKQHCDHPITTVINFPSGEVLQTKLQKELVLAADADEIDVVFPYQQYLAEPDPSPVFERFIKILQQLPASKIVKVIVESGAYRNPQDLHKICQFLIELPIQFIKTSTGKIEVGATIEAATIILENIKGRNIGLKVSGGIRQYQQALAYFELAQQYLSQISAKNFRIGASKLIGLP
jgi:deoxyribose-phosphate aldolase